MIGLYLTQSGGNLCKSPLSKECLAKFTRFLFSTTRITSRAHFFTLLKLHLKSLRRCLLRSSFTYTKILTNEIIAKKEK